MLLRAEAVQGTCRVVCLSPRHDVTLSRMPTDVLRAVVDAWADELSRAAASESTRYVQVFENRGTFTTGGQNRSSFVNFTTKPRFSSVGNPRRSVARPSE